MNIMNRYENIDFDGSMRNNDIMTLELYMASLTLDMNKIERINKVVYHTRLFLEWVYTGFSRN